MNTVMTWQTLSTGFADTERLGKLLGSLLQGGEVIELHSDLGGGKTTLVRGLARGLGSKDLVTSPTFTINRIYKGRGGLQLHHFDFYRLSEPGILTDELEESLNDPKVITAVEWSEVVKDVLPQQRLSIELKPSEDNADTRQITIFYPEPLAELVRELESVWTESEP